MGALALPAPSLRLIVIGGTEQTSALKVDLERLGQAGATPRVTSAGRVTGALLGQAAADAVVIFMQPESGFSAEARRECLLAWGLGAYPIVAIEAGPGRNAAELRATQDAFGVWARRLGSPEPAWADLAADPQALLRCISARSAALKAGAPLRYWVESIDNVADGSRVTGTPVSGALRVGQAVVAMPPALSAGITRIDPAVGGRATIVLDRKLELAPGMLLTAADNRPELADQIAAHVVWTGEQPLLPGRSYRIKLGPQTATAQVSTLKHKVNPLDLDPIAARHLAVGELGLCNLSFSAALLFDPHDRGTPLSRFELQDQQTGTTVGYGRVAFTLRRATNIHWQALSVDKGARASLKHQRPCCLWLTGLSGSGKSTIASLLEKRLTAAGRHTYTLDGDNVRHGLNRDLGFTDADRVENIRRVGEVAKLFVDAGLIVLVSFISPFRAERQMARDLMGAGEFMEIFVDTPITICETRDAKGLYKKARAGALKNFTGIDSPYEPPEAPEIHLKGGEMPPEALVDQIMREIERRGMV